MSTTSLPGGRVALFFLYDTLEPFAFVRDALSMLVERGYEVDIYASMRTGLSASGSPLPGVRMLPHPEAFRVFKQQVPRLMRFVPKGRKLFELFTMNISRPLSRKFSFDKLFLSRHHERPYVCVIGQDPEGLVSAAPYAERLGVPLIYWSFELLLSEEALNSGKKKLKQREIIDNHKAEITLIQDQWRGDAIRLDNGIDPASLIFVPNAPRGAARRQKSDYLSRRLNIAPEKKIILCAGMLGHWTMSAELAGAAMSWPEEYVLVLQSHSPRALYGADPHLDELVRSVDPARVIISFDPVPSSDYRALMDSADVGLAFYAPQSSRDSTQGRNVYLMGLSSGKFAGYLHSGLPVVANDGVIGPRDVVDSSGCGISVSSPDQISSALEGIFRNYQLYSDNSVRYFNQDLELGARFGKVIERIEKFSGKRETIHGK